MARLLFLVSLVIMSGCAKTTTVLSPAERKQIAVGIAENVGFVDRKVTADPFVIQSWYRPAKSAALKATLFVFLEGDGQAFLGKSRVSTDPTPSNPMALKVAVAASKYMADSNVVYLARPCQYLKSVNAMCQRSLWTTARFSQQIKDNVQAAILAEIVKYEPSQTIVTGFSGGGALAMLVASDMPDVDGVITLAGNLDLAAFGRHHRVRPLVDSLDPAALDLFPKGQRHLHVAGSADRVIPVDLLRDYTARHGYKAATGMMILPDVTHNCCWPNHWPEILGTWKAVPGYIGNRSLTVPD